MEDKQKKIPKAFTEGLGFVYTHPGEELKLSRCCSDLIGEGIIEPRFNMEEIAVSSIKHNPLYEFISGHIYGNDFYSSGVLIAVINPILEIKNGGLKMEFPGSSKMSVICNAYDCRYAVYNMDELARN
jgi:hypothetical protein